MGCQRLKIDSEQTSRGLGGRRNLLLAGSGWESTMKIAARVSNAVSGHTLEVETDGRKQSIAVAPKTAGPRPLPQGQGWRTRWLRCPQPGNWAGRCLQP
jgi:hypothetical protein